MKREHVHLPATLEAVEALGAQIATARRVLGWTTEDLAGRLGITRQLMGRIERGSPSTAIGTVLEAAVVCGVPLFGTDAAGLSKVAERARNQLALLPDRVRTRTPELDNDF